MGGSVTSRGRRGGGRPTPLLCTASVERGRADRCFERLSGKRSAISARNIVLRHVSIRDMV